MELEQSRKFDPFSIPLWYHEGLRTQASATFSAPPKPYTYLLMHTPPLSKRFRPTIILSATT
jgi:hypothetical protein